MRVVANSSLATAVIDYNFLSKCKAESWFFKPWISWNSLWLEPNIISPGFVFFKIFNFINLPHKTRDLKTKQIQPSIHYFFQEPVFIYLKHSRNGDSTLLNKKYYFCIFQEEEIKRMRRYRYPSMQKQLSKCEKVLTRFNVKKTSHVHTYHEEKGDRVAGKRA